MFGKVNYASKRYTTWQERLEEVRAFKRFIDENRELATPLEYKAMSENFQEAREAHRPAIEAGAIGEFDQAINNLRQSRSRLCRSGQKR